jgi:hypothetical protein
LSRGALLEFIILVLALGYGATEFWCAIDRIGVLVNVGREIHDPEAAS